MDSNRSGLDAFTGRPSSHDPPDDRDPEQGGRLQRMLWVRELRERYQWDDAQPAPETVVERCRERGIALEELLDRMDDGQGTGWERWKWFVGQLEAYTGPEGK